MFTSPMPSATSNVKALRGRSNYISELCSGRPHDAVYHNNTNAWAFPCSSNHALFTHLGWATTTTTATTITIPTTLLHHIWQSLPSIVEPVYDQVIHLQPRCCSILSWPLPLLFFAVPVSPFQSSIHGETQGTCFAILQEMRAVLLAHGTYMTL